MQKIQAMTHSISTSMAKLLDKTSLMPDNIRYHIPFHALHGRVLHTCTIM